MNSANTLVDLLTSYLPDLPWLRVVVKLLVTLLLLWALLLASRRLLLRVRRFASSRAGGAEEQRRIDTLSLVFRYAITLVVLGVGVGVVLSEMGISVAPLLGAAGVAGVAIGFGSQSVVKDFLAGFFLLVENQVRVGDVVALGGKDGTVEAITLRHVRLRDANGDVHFVPTGKIDTVTNKSMEYAYAVLSVGVGYGEDVDEVCELLREVGKGLRKDPKLGARTLADLEVSAIDELADSAVMIGLRMKTVPLEQWAVKRELLKRIKVALDGKGVELPYRKVSVVRARAVAKAEAVGEHR